MTREEIHREIRQILVDHFALDPAKTVPENESFLGSGTIDSAGIVRLICLLEKRFKIEVRDDEIAAENFDSVFQACQFIYNRMSQRAFIQR